MDMVVRADIFLCWYVSIARKIYMLGKLSDHAGMCRRQASFADVSIRRPDSARYSLEKSMAMRLSVRLNGN
jgi:hypothetical protein